MHVKNGLGDIQPDCDSYDTEASLSGASTPQLWHIDAVGGRPPHQLSGSVLDRRNDLIWPLSRRACDQFKPFNEELLDDGSPPKTLRSDPINR
jgi:hypothetical protein